LFVVEVAGSVIGLLLGWELRERVEREMGKLEKGVFARPFPAQIFLHTMKELVVEIIWGATKIYLSFVSSSPLQIIQKKSREP